MWIARTGACPVERERLQLILRGFNPFSSQTEHALLELEGTPHFLILVDGRGIESRGWTGVVDLRELEGASTTGEV